MAMTIQERRALKAERVAAQERMAARNLEARTALHSNTCPSCKGNVHRNLALTGWVQCDGFGAVGFRKNPNAMPCNWQGFTGE